MERLIMEYQSEKIMTIPEVASFLKMSKAKIYYLIDRREIPHLKIGRNVRVLESDLIKWLAQQRVN
jgi:excisionase family DNA binding protein